MAAYEYEVTTYPADTFKRLVYFCKESGGCTLEEVPQTDVAKLKDVLNEHGKQGWELVQMTFCDDGVMAFWKRAQ